jgi:hypothetical protein
MILACPALGSSERPGKLQVTPHGRDFGTHNTTRDHLPATKASIAVGHRCDRLLEPRTLG